MKSHTQAFWLSVLLTITLTCLSHKVAAQSGFLSVDCGAPAAYLEKTKGISWVPDDAYISGGMTASVTTVKDPAWNSHLVNLRYFPDTARTRYCYSLPTTVGKNYLLRAIFFHGGYDNSPVVKFDVAFDLFDTRMTLGFDVQGGYHSQELIFRSFREDIQFCLFRISPTDNPFISSLELRPLDDTMYPAVAGGSALLVNSRLNLGPIESYTTRYPEDPYDRFWLSPGSSTGFKFIKASSVQDTGYALDKPPPAIMNTATTLDTEGYSMWITATPIFSKNPFVINVFLAELENLNALSRTFDILMNDVVVVPNVNVYTLAQNSLYVPIEFSSNSSKVDAKGDVNITLSRTGSSLGPPPIWNALEFYSVQSKQAGTFASDASAIEGLKKAFGLGAVWTGDPCLLVPYDWLTCSITSPPRVTVVRLSSAGLAGPIPDLHALTSLTTLYLDNNKLTGPIPEWLASLPNLKELYLQNNQLSGDVPKALLKLPVIRLEGNPGLCVNTTCPKGNKSNVMIIVGVSVGAFVAIGIVIAIVVALCCCRKKVKGVESTPQFPPIVKEEGSAAPGLIDHGGATRGSRYTLAQVMEATKNNAKMLGRGGFGPVYYGKLATRQEVAAKVSAKGSNQGSKEFINEIELLTRVHHKNLVSLVGYCDEGENLILLYEYMSKGTVQEHLYGMGQQRKHPILGWKTRLQIALNSALGLEYLHVGCNPVIFHRDVKSNNILLNDKLVAKVADFGLSKSTELNENVTHMSTVVKGTIGYLDPEYYMSNQLTDKSDVYSFGIVLLELICARPPFVPQLPKEEQLLDKWVRPHLQDGTIEEIVDPALAGQYNLDSMWKVADLAMMSVEPKGMHRPTMSTIVHELRTALELENCSSTSTVTLPPRSQRPSSGYRFDAIESSSSKSTTRPPSQRSSSGFRFDAIQSSSSVSDPYFGTNSTVQAR